jgi:hypothetical protein
MNILKRTQDLHALLDQGKDLEALDIFFHEDLVATEMPDGSTRHGVEAQKKAVEEFMAMVQDVHGGGTKTITANEEAAVSMAESWMEATYKGAPGPVKISEITVYRWQGDKIKEMNFYYHNPMAEAQPQ